jgi:arylsulfatase A-like enzyme
MITRMDADVGKLTARLKELNIDENTIVIFTSDNGPLYDKLGGTDAEFFKSAGPFRGRKGGYYEGGFRVPSIIRFPGRVAAGSTSDRVTGFEDWLPTLLELAGAKDSTPAGLDGISFAPTLLGQPQPARPFLYRESPGYGGQQCIRVGDWKAIRTKLNQNSKAAEPQPGLFELYNLASDPGETRDVAVQHPDVVERVSALMKLQHGKSELFPIRALDGGANAAKQ